jgi:hypothetical protein
MIYVAKKENDDKRALLQRSPLYIELDGRINQLSKDINRMLERFGESTKSFVCGSFADKLRSKGKIRFSS